MTSRSSTEEKGILRYRGFPIEELAENSTFLEVAYLLVYGRLRHIEISVHRLLAKIITLAAYAYKHSIGQPFLYPRNDLSTTSVQLPADDVRTPCEDVRSRPGRRARSSTFC